jgi:cbb3-type cytochrome oxidase maturation protein
MGTVFLLTGLACVLFLVGAVLLTWGVRAGQWDDLDTPAERMLGDDPPAPKPPKVPQP